MKLTRYVQELQVLTDRIKWIKPLLRPFAKFYYSHIDKTNINRRDNLHTAFSKHGLEVLDCFDKTMESNGYRYSLAFGTMLGAVREHGFISHDLDIDVFVWYDEYDDNLIESLKKVGFSLKHTFIVENGTLAREDTIEKEGVQIDIFYLYPPLEGCQYPYCCDFFPRGNCRSWEQSIRMYGGLLPRRLEMPTSKNIIKVPFETLLLPILANAHEFLSFRYGDDYMTPNSKWTNGDNPYIIPWEDKMACLIEYN